MQILDATADHAEGIAAIYNHAVEHTTAIWNERLVDADDRAAWLAARTYRWAADAQASFAWDATG